MKPTCLVCLNVDCKARGSEKLMSQITEKVAARGLDVEVKPYICFGGCDHGPNIVLYPQKIWYAGVKPEDLPDIVESIAGGPKVDRLDTIDSSLKEMIFQLLDAGVF
ncbi:MAG TPA: (2Fe-2S) ferredoxin domain-containing protein [Methylomirabilota bacterium]|nr:(2Fe-2S) ferredoxin domain-containing protein [Methylomirabilota bacterium]